MPTRQVTVRSCDICDGEPATETTIILNGQVVQVDLCQGCMQPLIELFEKYGLASSKAPGRSVSPHRCELCKKIMSRRRHALVHVQRQHGLSLDNLEGASEFIRPVGARMARVRNGRQDQPHRCLICKRPYANYTTARRHVEDLHPGSIKKGKNSGDYVSLIEMDA